MIAVSQSKCKKMKEINDFTVTYLDERDDFL